MEVDDDLARRLATRTLLSYAQSLNEATDWMALGKALGWTPNETKAYAESAIISGVTARQVAAAMSSDAQPLEVTWPDRHNHG